MFSLEIHRSFLAMDKHIRHFIQNLKIFFSPSSFLRVQEAAEVLAPWLETILQHLVYAFGIYQVCCAKARYMHACLLSSSIVVESVLSKSIQPHFANGLMVFLVLNRGEISVVYMVLLVH